MYKYIKSSDFITTGDYADRFYSQVEQLYDDTLYNYYPKDKEFEDDDELMDWFEAQRQFIIGVICEHLEMLKEDEEFELPSDYKDLVREYVLDNLYIEDVAGV